MTDRQRLPGVDYIHMSPFAGRMSLVPRGPKQSKRRRRREQAGGHKSLHTAGAVAIDDADDDPSRALRAAAKAARRASKRQSAAFDLVSVSDTCAALVLDTGAVSVDVTAVTTRQRRDVAAVASLYRLRVDSCRGSPVVRIQRSPYMVAALPDGQAEVALACVLSRGAGAVDLEAVLASSGSPETRSVLRRPAQLQRRQQSSSHRDSMERDVPLSAKLRADGSARDAVPDDADGGRRRDQGKGIRTSQVGLTDGQYHISWTLDRG